MTRGGIRYLRSAALAAGLWAAAGPAAAQSASEPALKLPPERILALQLQELNELNTPHDQRPPRRNGFTRRLDEYHRRLYCAMDNAVRTVDLKWLAEEAPYEPELSTFRLRLYSRFGGRSSDKSSDFKIRFRGDVALPGLARQLHLVLDNAGQDSLPGTDPMKKESDPRLGVTTMFEDLSGGDLSLGGGLRWRDSHPVAYVSLN